MKKFNGTSLPEKDNFYSHLNMEDIMRMQNEFVKISKYKKSGKYHDLYVQSKTLLSCDVFENFRDMCLQIEELWSYKTFFSSWISMTSILKKD